VGLANSVKLTLSVQPARHVLMELASTPTAQEDTQRLTEDLVVWEEDAVKHALRAINVQDHALIVSQGYVIANQQIQEEQPQNLA